MSESQRILSGSKTKGSRVTQQSEMIPFYQGTNIKTIGVVGDRLNPQLRSGDLLGVFKDNIRMRSPQFDDTITINNTLNDLREDNDRFEQRLVFDLEKANFGVAPETPQGEPFADLIDFNPVVYLQDPGTFMYPSNLWNLGELPNHEFDGIMEVFDKRKSILGQVDLRYEGRTTRGALIGAASERPWGSKEIEDSWFATDSGDRPWLDAPVAERRILDPNDIMGPAEAWYLSPLSLSGHTYTEGDATALRLLGILNASPTNGASTGPAVAFTGVSGVDYEIESETIGSNTYNVHEYTGGAYPVNDDATIKLATPGDLSYWDNQIGTGLSSEGTSTISMWVKSTNVPRHASLTEEILVSMGQAQQSTPGANYELGYNKAGGTWYLRLILRDISPDSYKGSGSKSSGIGHWRLEALTDFLEDSAWHHIAVTCKVTNGTGAGAWDGSAPRNGTTLVEVLFYVDGVEYPAVFQSGASNFYSDWKIQNEDFQNPGSEPGVAIFRDTRLGTKPFRGAMAVPAIWNSVLTSDSIKATYAASSTKFNSAVVGEEPFTAEEIASTKVAISVQGYQDITQGEDDPFRQEDYHDKVYFSVISHNNSDMRNALHLLNSSSCNNLTDPFEKTASRGFYFGNRAGSITFGDTDMLGEYK